MSGEQNIAGIGQDLDSDSESDRFAFAQSVRSEEEEEEHFEDDFTFSDCESLPSPGRDGNYPYLS
jgi:hypothetical protein